MKKTEKIIAYGDLFKESWLIYKKQLIKFLEVFVRGLVGFIPMFALLLLFGLYGFFGLSNLASDYTNVVLGIVFVFLFIASLCLAIVYGIRVKVASILLLKNNFSAAKDNFNKAKPYFKQFLGVSLLFLVLVFAWGTLLFIPAIIFGIYYGFSQYVLVDEDKRPFSATERSYDLVHGYWWPTFGRLLLMFVMVMLINFVISLPLEWLDNNTLGFFTANLLINVFWAVASPYLIIYSYQVYKSLKKVNK